MNLKYKKDYIAKALSKMEQLPETKLRTETIAAIKEWQAAVTRLEEVEDVVGKPGTPCPVQSQTAIAALRHVFGIPVKPQAKVRHVPVPTQKPFPTSALPSCGPGPYCAKIVSARNLYETVWAGPHVYKTEADAVRAVLRKAVREANLTHRWTVDKDCVRHWVTERKEHVMDFGSHAYYGVVTGKETL